MDQQTQIELIEEVLEMAESNRRFLDAEDFAIGESIQKGLNTGANTHLTFGRFEGALEAFNLAVDSAIE